MKRSLCALLAVLSFATHAAPAPWYWWTSKISGKRVCSQTSPGEGWERGNGPFRNSRCER
ncbi:MAG: hypothetical protein H6R19_3323 [Proteobacteria bacterium]|nr:hypothetical protein [Pseudomonadota bacterium]